MKASWLPAGQTFLFDGATSAICPMCHVFIAKNHSATVRLPTPLAPRTTEDGCRSADTGRPYFHDGRAIRRHPRWFVHERCWPRYLALAPDRLWFEGTGTAQDRPGPHALDLAALYARVMGDAA